MCLINNFFSKWLNKATTSTLGLTFNTKFIFTLETLKRKLHLKTDFFCRDTKGFLFDYPYFSKQICACNFGFQLFDKFLFLRLSFIHLILYACCRCWFLWKKKKTVISFHKSIQKYNVLIFLLFSLELFQDAHYTFLNHQNISTFLWLHNSKKIYFSPTAWTFHLIWKKNIFSWWTIVFRWINVWQDISLLEICYKKKIISHVIH